MKKYLTIASILVLTLCMVTGCRMRASDETSMPTNQTTTRPTTTTQMPTTTQAPIMPSTGESGTTQNPGSTGDIAPDGTIGNNGTDASTPARSGRGRFPSASHN